MINPKTEYEIVEYGSSYKIVATYPTQPQELITTITSYTEITGFPTKSDAYGYLLLMTLFK